MVRKIKQNPITDAAFILSFFRLDFATFLANDGLRNLGLVQ